VRSAHQLRQDAEAKFKKKELQRLDGNAAMAEYQAAGLALVERTAHLRALRLSRESREAARAAPREEQASKKRA
jgi:hypothetical protein